MPTPQEIQWMKQWRIAEKGLADQKAHDLAHLSEDRAREISFSLLSLAANAHRDPKRRDSSGLVEQQKWFARWKS